MPDLLEDPLAPKHGLTLTPFHIIVLLLSSLSLFLSNLTLPHPLPIYVGMMKRIMVLLVLLMIAHHFVLAQMQSSKEDWNITQKEKRSRSDPLVKSKIEHKKDDWTHPNAHPSHFLTTRDGKPRLFPFPLGKAGGMGTKELWWEAGNTAHVGHFNQRETLEMREPLRLEMEAKEKARVEKAKKTMKEFEKKREKWQKRLTHLKIIGGIVVLSLMYFAELLKFKEEEEEKPAQSRKKIPTTPGMAMTYIYEPTPLGPKPAGAIPTKSPSHRLMTSLDSRYAS
ncbi:hypothetical protein CI109_106409 [Kwoniella shandongensis]|uniref:Uncharacterized protein n=1 Tax=Kwoniella shandongensis TaxID=1734106 RepID=A0A5M6C5T1_9TREE|nr:uncharacterized protein CI109_002592 [Kwoniella shandongensis]KAA5528835.1 hypothetical protein CI109_002592 [Kwoniella shandongensis]